MRALANAAPVRYLNGRGNNTSLSSGRSRTSSVDSAIAALYLNIVQYEPGTWTLGSGGATAPVPEPSSWLLMGAGVAGVLLHRRRAVTYGGTHPRRMSRASPAAKFAKACAR